MSYSVAQTEKLKIGIPMWLSVLITIPIGIALVGYCLVMGIVGVFDETRNR